MQKVETLRVLSGIMTGARIDILGSPTRSYTLSSARVVDGKLQFTGALSGRGVVTSTLAGTTARASNPLPRASDADAPRRTVANEQTQSLYAATENGSGCEMIFLRMPGAQLGVVLAHKDNPLGESINRAICRVRRTLDARTDANAALESLNRLLKQ